MHAASILCLCCIISERFFFEDKTLGSVTLIMNLLLMLQIKVVENELHVMIFVTLHFLFKPKNYD